MEPEKFVFLLIFLLVANEAKADIEERLKEDFYNIYKHTAKGAREVVDEPVTPDRINYYLYTKNNPGNYIEIDPSNPEPLANKNVNLRVVFIIHGWTGSRKADWYEDLKNAFLLKEEEYYVVQVDWSDPANQLYTISSYNTKDVGHIIGEFIVGLHRNYSIPLENFLIVGHSLGGQVGGFIGKKVQELTDQKLPRIVALDPAGPFFDTRPDDKRLNKNDAEVVEVIHTDGGTFGFKDSCGTIDFFPNGGNSQPGCKKIDLLDIKSVAEPVSCDHHRSYEYYVEALLNPSEFLGTRCKSWSDFEDKKCDEQVKVAMGDLKSRETGNFYLETNSEKPYSRRKEGSFVGRLVSLLPH